MFCHNPCVWKTNGQTDRRTDRRTDLIAIDRVYIPCSGVKNLDRFFFPFVKRLTDGQTYNFLATRPPCIQCSAVKSWSLQVEIYIKRHNFQLITNQTTTVISSRHGSQQWRYMAAWVCQRHFRHQHNYFRHMSYIPWISLCLSRKLTVPNLYSWAQQPKSQSVSNAEVFHDC